MPSCRLSLLLALAVGVVLPGAPSLAAATAYESATRGSVTVGRNHDEADEILLEVGYSWTLKGTRLRGTVTNSDRSDVSGTAKVTRGDSGRTVTLATGGKLSVAVGHEQVLSLSLTRTGREFFRRHKKATAELVLHETAGTRSGDDTEDIRIRRAA